MGNCVHSAHEQASNSASTATRTAQQRIILGKNKPLKRDTFRWKSQCLLTSSQLQRKREEFWDTAPAFDGRIEIWNALKAAAGSMENNDFELAQAIIDGANIILPTGTLCDCYDELGTRYQLPLYVLSPPVNLVEDEPSSDESPPNPPSESATVSTNAVVNQTGDSAANNQLDSCLSPTTATSRVSRRWWNLSARQTRERSQSTCGFAARSSFWSKLRASRKEVLPITADLTHEPLTQLRLRLSTGEEHVLETNPFLTVLGGKRMLASRTGWPEARQRWFACGRMLSNRALLSDCNIPKDFLIQVVVHSPFDPESQWIGMSQLSSSRITQASMSAADRPLGENHPESRHSPPPILVVSGSG